jgi:hypothetical protein
MVTAVGATLNTEPAVGDVLTIEVEKAGEIEMTENIRVVSI